MKKILILGATSGVALKLYEQIKSQGDMPILAARNLEKLKGSISDDKTPCYKFEAKEFSSHRETLNTITKDHDLDGAILAFGVIHYEKEAEEDWEMALDTISCNFTGSASMLNLLADYFETRKQGFISVITSVAGDRGRKSNYIYGSTKAALNTYLEGMRCRLASSHIFVQTIKLGPTDTPMNRDIKNPPPMISAEKAAKRILKAIKKGKEVVYVPGRWRLIMTVIRLMPRFIFKKVNF